MGEVVPRVAVAAVVFADRTPLPLAEIGTPLLPRHAGFPRIVQPLLLDDVHHLQLSHGSLRSAGVHVRACAPNRSRDSVTGPPHTHRWMVLRALRAERMPAESSKMHAFARDDDHDLRNIVPGSVGGGRCRYGKKSTVAVDTS